MLTFQNSEFDYTNVYYHLKQHFIKQVKINRTPDELQAEENQLAERLSQLPSKVVIPPSRLDDAVREIIKRVLGTLPVETAQGLSFSIAHLKDVDDELYDLTVLGQIEIALRDHIIDKLRRHLKDVEGFVKEQEDNYNRMVSRAWDAYQEEMDEFEVGDYGYDDDGPTIPRKPRFKAFNRRAAVAERQQQLAELDLDDPVVVLKEAAPRKQGFLGDLLHEYFEDSEFIDDIIQALDFSHLNQVHLTHFLRTNDFYFPDCNILKRGFLLEVLIDNIRHDFKSDRSQVDIHEHIVTLFAAISTKPQCKALLAKYNKAVEDNDNLELQRLWIYISAFCNIVEKALKQKNLNVKVLAGQLELKRKEIEREQGGSLKALIKVFPADTADQLFYPGISPEDKSYYPSADAKLPLKPYFHTLELIARGTHEALSKVSGTKDGIDKTNVVSAMLCFVVSTEPDKTFALTGRPPKQVFINVPVNFDYKSVLLSFDEVFSDEDDIEKNIGSDLELGTRVTGRDVTMPVDEATSAKKKILRLLSTLNLDEETQSAMLANIEAAEISAPVTLSYYTSSDIAKSTEHRHSERVLNRALKQPENVAKIVAQIKTSMLESGITKPGTYTIHGGALLVYSYPNSICDECSISFLALQNSYEAGFIAEFVSAANSSHPTDLITLRTRGFNPLTRAQDPDEFSMTVIAGSSKVFAKDAYAKLVANRPEAKYSCHVMPFSFSEEGINLRYKKSPGHHNRFYEYTADSQLHADNKVSVKYAGLLFMSGSKSSKLSGKKQSQLESDVKTIVADNDKATSVVSGVNHH